MFDVHHDSLVVLTGYCYYHATKFWLNCNEGGERMEIFLYITLVLMAFSVLVEKLTNFFKQLHSSKSNKLLASGRTLKAEIKISASDKKKKRS